MKVENMTVVYEVVDDAVFQASGNPLRYQHHGLKAHTIAAYDAVERYNKMRMELDRLRDVVCPEDVASIDAVLDFPGAD